MKGFDWTMAGLLRKFAPLADESRVTGFLACPTCSFAFNDYKVVKGTRIPNVLRGVTGKTHEGYSLVCGHTANGFVKLHREEFVSDVDLGESLMELLEGVNDGC